MHLLHTVWNRLHTIQALEFTATSHSRTRGWTGHGRGSVAVTQNHDTDLICTEMGTWTTDTNVQLAFRNVYRWTIDKKAQLLHLEHLRFGPEQPVYLCALSSQSTTHLCSVQPHLCGPDQYMVSISIESGWLAMHWDIQGPHKNEQLSYWYD
ncbi:MAG: ArsR family transcriptional regulator [Chloroflexi bacterium AL-W]|nr:ArsR family transcriptional regulator [Chloroflexi bacterium AL-N1]NOK68921.1 ArsR family transcriptional regulator [Chloroflexi bacterium AL-N10]NOK76904.1 ArsR family transcriptional regulator [Chloroflexi bacterium AL-N5]NOK82708.1 ArsR family transcriptional regulator [Chloroflexi bacterium AL-W]NOK90761.1 ArsR family transcriptional regulator [Chloroflexi bacterium AL-N15]